jgi:large subunit ribosomal protein L24
MDIAVPQWMIDAEPNDKRTVRSVEQPIRLDKIRLVFPLTNPETGITADVIVKKVVNGKMWADKHLGIKKWTRYIPGLNIKIPWPKLEPIEHKDHPMDTLRLDVETRSFVPTLLTPPMPATVINELRNKYSIFRTRHDPEYIAAKMEEDRQAEEKKNQSEEMRTPLKEINRKERKLRKAKGKGKLTDEMLEKIGEVIFKKRQLAMDAAGVSKVGTAPETLTA